MSNRLCRWFGHRLEPRYSQRERRIDGDVKVTTFAGKMSDFRDLLVLRQRIYHGEICTRCGYARSPKAQLRSAESATPENLPLPAPSPTPPIRGHRREEPK